MGGYGSGSRQRYAPKTDEYRKIDLSDFSKTRRDETASGTIIWSRAGKRTASIGYELSPHSLRLYYSMTRQGEGSRVDEHIAFDFTAQPFGGDRRWFLCRSCGRRCRVLYGGAYFRCRQCYGAVYESQYQHWRFPCLSSSERVRHKLGGQPGFCHPFPQKPKGMHWKTYRRLQDQDWQAIMAIEGVLNTWR